MAQDLFLTPSAEDGDVPSGCLSVIVTYLEMDRPPHHRPLPRPSGDPLLMRAAPPSVSFYRYLYDTVGEPWLWNERRRMDDAELRAVVTDKRVEVHVLYLSGTPAGYVEIDRRDRAATDIAYFGMLPDFIGLRLGPWLLDQGIRMAWAGRPRLLTVNTCTFDHPKALPLYQSMGFRPVRHVTRIISDPRLTGVLPRHAAPHIPVNE
ncbi:MAG TPA: GNAT family N-acetyltransferase [Azospirillum sp.]